MLEDNYSKTCHECGSDFTSTAPAAKYCSTECREDASDRKRQEKLRPNANTGDESQLEKITRATLKRSRLDVTPQGIAVLILARTFDRASHHESIEKIATLSREFRIALKNCLGENTSGEDAEDELEKLRKRKEQKLG